MAKKETNSINYEEAIMNLLILSLLKDGVSPKAIAIATGIAEKTIRNNFPMNIVRGKD